MTDDIAKIAAGLSKAQRGWILCDPLRLEWPARTFLKDRGFLVFEHYKKDGKGHRKTRRVHTPLGLAVRDYLKDHP